MYKLKFNSDASSPSVITVSMILEQLSATLLVLAQVSILSNLGAPLRTCFGTMRYVSSVHLARKLPVRSTALTSKKADPVAEPWMTLKVIGTNAEVSPLNLVQ